MLAKEKKKLVKYEMEDKQKQSINESWGFFSKLVFGSEAGLDSEISICKLEIKTLEKIQVDYFNDLKQTQERKI